ncbi:MAG TPA: hypothetical protein VK921_04470, partial [Anditalea sp.]|nr:hypothetical protein [Anditalea sp.]
MKKDWRNLSDKELDEVFRQASKHPPLPFDQKDWEMMQEKLDKTVWLFPIHRVLTWGLFLGLLLLAVLHFIGQEKEIYNREYATYSEEHIPPTSLSILSEDGLNADKILVENRQITTQTASPSRAESFRTIAITPIELPEMDIKHLTVDFKDHFIGDQLLHNSSEKPITPASITHSKFSLTLMASPDISAFKVNEINGLGNNVGVYLEYFIKSNLSLVSGATYGNKIYRTSITYSGYYPSSSRIWDGECKVLDIPVNLRYYAI